MKIAILGNGRMGKQISKLAKERGHSIIAVSSSKKPAKNLNVASADVAVDFSTPSTAFDNIKHALESGVPVISGTTGWLNKLSEIKELCINKSGSFLYSPNFSLGMNIFFELNKKLATLMKNQNYKSIIHEIHHTEKLDSPSGTALSLEEQINNILAINTPITSDRIKDVLGTHSITYNSSVDEIDITHTATNRDGFAMGAIIAAEWIIGRKGVFSMKDILAQ
jgi:4-hydroxy-tetrahydrodipicolinate reductase